MRTLRKTSVSRLMSRDLITVRRDAQLAPVVELMMRRGLGEIPVVDSDRALLGVVTRTDLLNPPSGSADSAEEFLARAQQKATVTCELVDGFRMDVEASATVGDVMSREVIAVTPETTAAEAASLMAAHRLAQLPVIGPGGGLIGMVSAIDIASLLN
jgi:CBS domain-containing protein